MIIRSIRIHGGTQLLEVATNGASVDISLSDIAENANTYTTNEPIINLSQQDIIEFARILRESVS